MKKSTTQYPPTVWKKSETQPCPSGKCKHLHIRKSGPCTEMGCGCHGRKSKKER